MGRGLKGVTESEVTVSEDVFVSGEATASASGYGHVKATVGEEEQRARFGIPPPQARPRQSKAFVKLIQSSKPLSLLLASDGLISWSWATKSFLAQPTPNSPQGESS